MATNPNAVYAASALLVVFGAILFYAGFRIMKHLRLITDTPTSKIRSMAIGLVELKGKVGAPKTITSPFSRSACVYYRYKIEELRVTRNSKGKTSRRWATVGSGTRHVPFLAKDETGQCYIQPANADFDIPCKRTFYQRAGLFGALNTIVNALQSFDQGQNVDTTPWKLEETTGKNRFRFSREGDRKYYEYYLEPEENLYVLGTAVPNPQSSKQLFVQKGDNQPTFLISNKSEKQLVKSQRRNMIACFFFAIVAILGGLALGLSQAGVV